MQKVGEHILHGEGNTEVWERRFNPLVCQIVSLGRIRNIFVFGRELLKTYLWFYWTIDFYFLREKLTVIDKGVNRKIANKQ